MLFFVAFLCPSDLRMSRKKCTFAGAKVFVERKTNRFMKKYVFLTMALLGAMSMSAQRLNPTYLDYIAHWKEVFAANKKSFTEKFTL